MALLVPRGRGSELFSTVDHALVGGARIAALDCDATADLMIDTALHRRGSGWPVVLSSVNGEVISRAYSEAPIRDVFATVDLLNADGQPLVLASKLFCANPLPERVATTDLFHYVARRAVGRGVSFYFYGADEDENRRAVDRVRKLYPGLEIRGRHHGFLTGPDLEAKVEEINALKPDILWVSLGVPREQAFCEKYRMRLSNVGILKTSGGLLNFLSGSRMRAPRWMQVCGLEWLWRIKEEPRRLVMRYARTNPRALLLLLRRSA